MEYHTAIERACKHAHENADEEARNGEYGSKYLKHLATAEFYRLVVVEDVSLGDRSVGEVAVDLMRGTTAIRQSDA